MYIGIHQYTV